MKLHIARIYESKGVSSSYRVLVDRVWPRGISKDEAHIDLWAKELAPSTELRKWFGHIPARFDEFSRRYVKELDANAEAKTLIAQITSHADVTLLYGAKDTTHNQAVVLQRYMANNNHS